MELPPWRSTCMPHPRRQHSIWTKIKFSIKKNFDLSLAMLNFIFFYLSRSSVSRRLTSQFLLFFYCQDKKREALLPLFAFDLVWSKGKVRIYLLFDFRAMIFQNWHFHQKIISLLSLVFPRENEIFIAKLKTNIYCCNWKTKFRFLPKKKVKGANGKVS